MFPPSSDSGSSSSVKPGALSRPVNGASTFPPAFSGNSLALSACPSAVTSSLIRSPGSTATPLISAPHPSPYLQSTPSSDRSIALLPSFDEKGRPFRYRCQSDTVVGQQDYPAHGHRERPGPLHYSLPASYEGIEAASCTFPKQIHYPSLASVHEDISRSPASPDSSDSDLRLTADIPTASTPASGSRGLPFSPARSSLQLRGAVTPVLSPSSIARILDASVAVSRPRRVTSAAVRSPHISPVSSQRRSRPQAAPGPSMACPPLTTGAPPRYPVGPGQAASVANGAPQAAGYYGQLPSSAPHATNVSLGCPRISSGITGSGIVAAPPTPRKDEGLPKTPRPNLLAPPGVTTGAPYETSSTHDRQWVAVTAYRPVDVVTKTVEVPVTRTVDVLVPRPVIKEKIVEVPKIVPHYVEKIMEVPEIQWVDRVVEIPEYFYNTRYVPKVEIRENIIERPVYEDKWVEKYVEVPRVEEIVRYRDIIEAEEVIKYIPKGHTEEEWRGAPIFSVPPEHTPPLPPKWVSPEAAVEPRLGAAYSPAGSVPPNLTASGTQERSFVGGPLSVPASTPSYSRSLPAESPPLNCCSPPEAFR
ncbi:alveolin domain containing intermediate filament imc5 [Cystoisospora suis]|uniref:Alveolin domain containing intermediate filament imc5 n=1 Tax=Cystoisospora suis TaxID=483139 RepID=A0A2C6L094_9APIC|nr:alveolin domain containing intermediate filament imc5 [Cystoisospora suis]